MSTIELIELADSEIEELGPEHYTASEIELVKSKILSHAKDCKGMEVQDFVSKCILLAGV